MEGQISVPEGRYTRAGTVGSIGGFIIGFFAMFLAVIRHLGFLEADLERRLTLEHLLSQLYVELIHLELEHKTPAAGSSINPILETQWKQRRIVSLRENIAWWERELRKAQTGGLVMRGIHMLQSKIEEAQRIWRDSKTERDAKHKRVKEKSKKILKSIKEEIKSPEKKR